MALGFSGGAWRSKTIIIGKIGGAAKNLNPFTLISSSWIVVLVGNDRVGKR